MSNDPFESIRRMQEMWSKVSSPLRDIQKQIAWTNQINSPFQRIHEQINLFHSSVDPVHLGARQIGLNAVNPVFEQLQELTMSRSFLNAQGINTAFRIDFAKISPILELAQKQNFMVRQISQSNSAFGTVRRWESLLDNITESKHLDDEVEDVELILSPASVLSQQTAEEPIRNVQPVQPFTWRDLLQIVSILIALITWIDSGNTRDTSLAEEAYKFGSETAEDMSETLEDIYEFFMSNFPADPEESGVGQEIPENP
ncbi:hypothetical protein [Brevibacillus centrosporus]|uniref:hypothetical protein n=1 Tax=Brevibacillus centrosporus TaxID=54910 RepID=UPI003B01E5A7